MTIFTSYWHEPLLERVAQEMLLRYGVDALSNALVLVPNRRSAMAMREAFIKHSASTVLLPRILPLADAEHELLMTLARSQTNAGEILASLPPAMSRWQQRMLIAELVRTFEMKRTKQAASLHHVLALADTLIDIHDNLVRESIDIASIDARNLAFSDMPEHWQMNAEFLNLLFREWSAIERERRLITSARREQLLLQAITALWQEKAPSYPIWLVGSTGSMPAVRKLMSVVNSMTEGYVVLPNLDLESREDVPIGHAQYYVQAALKAMQADIAEIQILGASSISPRQQLWQHQRAVDVSGIELVTCAHEEEEAGVISLMAREALESPTKVIAIITPNTGLMKRIQQSLRRFDIHVNTPQGQPLLHFKAAQVYSRLLQCLREDVSTLSVLNLLHSEGVRMDDDAAQWSDFLYHFRQSCRGVLSDITVSERVRKLASTVSIAGDVARVVHDLEGLHKQAYTLDVWMEHLTSIYDVLVPEPLDGHEALADLFSELSAVASTLVLDVDDIDALMSEAFAKPMRTPDMAAHPRVLVLSPMEARLRQFDRVVLAGFNEGDWPQNYQPNPWVNLSQSARLGLPSPQAQVTLSAHDLEALSMAPECFITRSIKSGGEPTMPSRFLVRLEAICERAGIVLSAQPWVTWWKMMQDTEYHRISADAPAPPVHARPKTLRVTSLKYLFEDPYAIYAEYVLGIRELEPFDKVPDAATFGSLVHKLIEEMLRDGKSPDDASWLLGRVAHLESDGRLYSLWLPRIQAILAFVHRVHFERSCDAVDMEIKKEIQVDDVMLIGKIDRLEKQGSAYSIHDYKTGNSPEKKTMALGLEPQLIAYALMLSEETGIAPESLVYWVLPKARHEGALVPYDFGKECDLSSHMAALRAALKRLHDGDYKFHPLNPEGAYTGISRNDEWAA